jgi:hypothetical protein
MSGENLIPITEIESDFGDFLKRENNKRIFFSGRFGIGKTYFLKDFFNLHQSEYETFHLFPANYQISSNEDIIELLKYDILVELIKKDSDLLKEVKVKGIKDSTLLFYSWAKEKASLNDFLQSILSAGEQVAGVSPDPIFSLLGKLGKPLKDLLEIDKEFQDFKEKYIAGEKGLAEEYLKKIRSKNILEADYFSHLIREKIETLKATKKSILILDDMDRIDPDHIFRILNIFSAHFNDEDNKFGFDAVIIVGDVQNIKSIFVHKFGKGTDFEGYFDKFYTTQPYILDNKKIITEKIPYLVKQIKYQEPNLKGAIGESGYIKLLLSDVLSRAITVGRLNLRQLYKPINYNFTELEEGIYSENNSGNSFQEILDIGIKLLIAISGGDKAFFIEVLKEIRNNIDDSDDGKSIPYRAYSRSMAQSLMKVSPGVQTIWKDYSFTVPLDAGGRDLRVEGSDANKIRFFYDLLIEYITKSKYIKSGRWEYGDI